MVCVTRPAGAGAPQPPAPAPSCPDPDEPLDLVPECPDCPDEPLDLVQPDPRQPEVVLGCCAKCGAMWSIGERPVWPIVGRFRVPLAEAS